MTTTLTIEELEQSGERELGTSDWHEITQEQIDLFAARVAGRQDVVHQLRNGSDGETDQAGTIHVEGTLPTLAMPRLERVMHACRAFHS